MDGCKRPLGSWGLSGLQRVKTVMPEILQGKIEATDKAKLGLWYHHKAKVRYYLRAGTWAPLKSKAWSAASWEENPEPSLCQKTNLWWQHHQEPKSEPKNCLRAKLGLEDLTKPWLEQSIHESTNMRRQMKQCSSTIKGQSLDLGPPQGKDMA